MVAGVYVSFCNAEGDCHTADNYLAFLKSPDYWGFLHLYYSFFCVIVCHLGLRKYRWMGSLFTAMYVLVAGKLWSIIQELSVLAYGAGSSVRPINTNWEAGDQTFDMIYNVAGVMFGLLFLLFANPVPNVVVMPHDVSPRVAPAVEERLKGSSSLYKKALQFGWSPWFAWFVWMVAVPVIVVSGGVCMLHLRPYLGVSETALFRVDFLLFAVYQCLVICVIEAIRGWGGCLYHLTSNLVNLENEKAYAAAGEVLDGVAIVQRRVAAEFIQLFVVSLVMFLLMLFNFMPSFYLEGYIAMGVGMAFLVIVRITMGSSRIRYGYQSMKPEMEKYSATNDVLTFSASAFAAKAE